MGPGCGLFGGLSSISDGFKAMMGTGMRSPIRTRSLTLFPISGVYSFSIARFSRF